MRVIETQIRISPTDTTDDAEPVWRAVSERLPEGSTDLVIDNLDLGVSYDLRFRYVDEATREVTEWVLWPGAIVVADALAPPAVHSLRLTKNDCLTWELRREILDLRGFYIRHAPGHHDGTVDGGWGLMEKAHEEIVTAPPFVLCRVPKGRRSFSIRPVDWDDNEGDPITILTNRGPLDDRAEFPIRTVDEAADLFANGTASGAIAPNTALTALAVPEADDDQPMFPDGIEPWMSADAETPMFPLDEDAPMFGETWLDAAEWFSRDNTDAMFGALYQWVEYVWSFTLHATEGGPGAVLSIDCECDARAWRLQYRCRDVAPAFPANPYDPLLPAEASDPMFTDDAARYWHPWPGRLLDADVGRYDFRLIVPGGHEQFSVTRLAVTYSRMARVEHVTGLEVPALGGTRSPPGNGEQWREIVEVRPIPVDVEVEHSIVVGNKSHAKGPELRVFADGVAATATVDATIRGY